MKKWLNSFFPISHNIIGNARNANECTQYEPLEKNDMVCTVILHSLNSFISRLYFILKTYHDFNHDFKKILFHSFTT